MARKKAFYAMQHRGRGSLDGHDDVGCFVTV